MVCQWKLSQSIVYCLFQKFDKLLGLNAVKYDKGASFHEASNGAVKHFFFKPLTKQSHLSLQKTSIYLVLFSFFFLFLFSFGTKTKNKQTKKKPHSCIYCHNRQMIWLVVFRQTENSRDLHCYLNRKPVACYKRWKQW